MKRFIALILAAFAAAPAIAMATPATAMNTTDGTQNIAVIPAVTEATAYFAENTAPPPIPQLGNTVVDVFEKVLQPADEARIIASPQPAISGGDTVNNGATTTANHVLTSPDVGKVATIGIDGISGYTNYALGGGAGNIAVVITAP